MSPPQETPSSATPSSSSLLLPAAPSSGGEMRGTVNGAILTRDFIEMRAQLQWRFITTKRNKSLWEMVADGMREKGYTRTVDQCRWKWKNLVTRYKGQHASDPDNTRQCPFFNELHALFTATDNKTQRARLISEDEEETINIDLAANRTFALEKRRKIGPSNDNSTQSPEILNNNDDQVLASLREMLGNIIEQQKWMDAQWKERMERRAREIGVYEQQWRQTMEKLEREKTMMEQAWSEKREQWLLKEEIRAEKTDALLTILVDKLTRKENR